MLSYTIRRILLMIPTLLGMTAIVFFTMALSPGGFGAALAGAGGENMEAEQAKAIREYYNQRYGLDQPVFVQYGRWLNRVSPIGFHVDSEGKSGKFGFKWPDLGYSYSKGRPVMDLYAEALPVTLLLNAITFPLIYIVALLAGIRAARHRGGTFDAASGSVFLALYSFPSILAGVLLIGFLADVRYVHWFPTGGLHEMNAGDMAFLWRKSGTGFEQGWLLDSLWHLVLPVICLTYGGFAFLSKLARGAVLENLSADYARTARAKGLGERDILFVHVLRNSLLPLITVAASILPGLIAGAVIVESIFSLQGMGKLAVEAVDRNDRELVLASTLIAGGLGLAANLIADLCYAVADPRVSYA